MKIIAEIASVYEILNICNVIMTIVHAFVIMKPLLSKNKSVELILENAQITPKHVPYQEVLAQ